MELCYNLCKWPKIDGVTGVKSPLEVEFLPSLKLTFSHLKFDGWKTILSFWQGLFSGAFAVSFRELKSYLYLDPGPQFAGKYSQKEMPWMLKKCRKAFRLGEMS